MEIDEGGERECLVSGATVVAVEGIRYSVLVAVDVAACF